MVEINFSVNPWVLYILVHFHQFAALDLLAIDIEGDEVHALREGVGGAPSVGVLAEGLGSGVGIYYQTSDVGENKADIVRTCLSYHVWDIHLGGEWVRIW